MRRSDLSEVTPDRISGIEKRLGGLETGFASILAEVGGMKQAQLGTTQAIDSLRAALTERDKPNYQLLGLLLVIFGGGWVFYTRDQDRTDERIKELAAYAMDSTAERSAQREQIQTQAERSHGISARMEDGFLAAASASDKIEQRVLDQVKNLESRLVTAFGNLDTSLQREMRDLDGALEKEDAWQRDRLSQLILNWREQDSRIRELEMGSRPSER